MKKLKIKIPKKVRDIWLSKYIYGCSNCNTEVYKNSTHCLMCGYMFSKK